MNRFHRWYCRSARWSVTVRDSLLPWVLVDEELGPDVLEVGPGPGITTDLLRSRVPNLTALELDSQLAADLRARLANSTTRVVEGDATMMPFEPQSFSAVVCFTMLHHVPSRELQDRLIAEAFRVLRHGGLFIGSDSRPSPLFRLAHLFDTMVLVDPEHFAGRLSRAGFVEVAVQPAPTAFRFRARRA